MSKFKYIVGIDVAQDSLAISIFDGKVHKISEIEYTSKKSEVSLPAFANSAAS